MIKNLLICSGGFVAIRLFHILSVSGYRLWFLWLDVPMIAILTTGAWLKSRAEQKQKAEIEALEERLKEIRAQVGS